MVGAAANRALAPGVHNIEHQRRLHADRRMQRRRRMPGAKAHARDKLTRHAGGMQRQRAAIAGDQMTRFSEAIHFDLHALDRRIDVARGCACVHFFAQHVPRLDGLTQFETHIRVSGRAMARETKLDERREPTEVERVTGALQITNYIPHVGRDKMRQHELIVQARAPTNELACVGRFPEARDQRAQQQHLRETHLCVRWHFEAAKLQQAQPTAGAVGRIQFVDAKFRAVCVTGEINQQVTQQPVDQPWCERFFACRLLDRQLLERDIQLVEIVVARLVHARRLTGGADELAGE